MKNNKGFTLIELLAVIVILVTISLTTVMGINASLERQDDKECEQQIQLAKNAAKIYFSLNDTNSVTISTLIDSNLIDKNKLDRVDEDVEITFNNGVYSISSECKQ